MLMDDGISYEQVPNVKDLGRGSAELHQSPGVLPCMLLKWMPSLCWEKNAPRRGHPWLGIVQVVKAWGSKDSVNINRVGWRMPEQGVENANHRWFQVVRSPWFAGAPRFGFCILSRLENLNIFTVALKGQAMVSRWISYLEISETVITKQFCKRVVGT